ncbi:gentisate 1,2-dioxygenase [Sphingomonas sp. QA11]|uniref:gentisate 1,2-dioxygenase n=1 Tax=Sphingomonas sp. QA11 TaxID=2950605 RepID=UPI00234A4C8D|nr:gentisate 1,2-dioxygenase [Sphingomonas sp. QA11]WCM28593.1 gentisate 1,2-dioxygenase [Sphingomonas sp. QA11]
MSILIPNDQREQLEQLYKAMAPESLTPLWEVLAALVSPTPTSPAVAHHWRYADAARYLMRAGDLISAEQAERRVLILENPGLPGQSAITPSLYAGLQLILPGEVAPAHRHTQSALRFVMEGEGAYTTVDGERAVMRPFDLVLTPSWQWHDHGNETSRPMVWLDGLDIPTVRHFAASFAEKTDEPVQTRLVADDDSLSRYGRNLRPLRGSLADRRPANRPLFHYPFAEWRRSLADLGAGTPDPHVGHALEFINPADGGPVLPTIAAQVQLIPAGTATRPRRSSDGAIHVVVEGTGTARIGERAIALSPRDFFVVPSWTTLSLDAASDLVLFSYSDRAAQQRLELYREERL